MPRKRRVEKLRHRNPTWRDFGPREKLNFWTAWTPPTNEFDRSRSHWQTWEAYLSDWAAVRAEALPKWEEKRAEMRASARAQVAQYAAELERAPKRDRNVWEPLLAWAKEKLEKEESKEMPFAEIAYQRVLAGRAPDGSEDEDEDGMTA
jgi:hypothetical protein